ncbi:PucR family transcriptional regulator [Paenibacillus cremeus]|uniref:PucR family transcriptional regulator n=1 Tax=Paenibacillus cremeus TaxID=2163881 RepID=A0A559KI29_9BACL|nr:PucR family transcriptional regulator [Paenibacillus cremeus]TVY11795.1 PucR family transcriptional regulator [Paenibacillus cremeus]
MAITVSEAMGIGGLVHCRIVAGERGMDRRMDSITVMEVPDVIRWLKGSVLLLTSLYPIKEDEQAIGQLVRQLHAAGGCALAIKTGPYVKEIPAIIKDEGNRLNFPIIEIHPDVSYLDIMTPLLERILKKLDTGKEQLDLFFQWMTELAVSGKGIAPLVEALEQMTDNPLTVGSDFAALELDKGLSFAPLTYAQKSELKTAKRPLRMNRFLEGALTPCIVTPMLLNDELYGEVTCWQTRRAFAEQDYDILYRTMVLMAMEWMKLVTKADVEQSFKDSFLSEVVLGRNQDSAETMAKGAQFGWELDQDFEVLCIAAEHQGDDVWSPERKRRVLQLVYSFFRYEAFKAIVTQLKGRVVVLLPARPRELPVKEAAKSLRQHLQEGCPELLFRIGMGRSYPGLTGIHQGYVEAVKALELGKPVGQQGCIHYEELGLFRLLSQFQDREELDGLYGETVGKLVAYDAIHQSGLVPTLETYFARNCSVSDTAEQLFIHVNTMKYRLQKMEQLTGCKVNEAEQRLLLHVGLKIHQLMKMESSY